MLAKGYMSEQLFGHTPNYPFSKFANLSQFRENALNRYPTNDMTSLSNWRKNPRISCFRDLVREEIAESFELEENHQVQEGESNLVNVLEHKLFAEAASEVLSGI
uniref:Uncharacterized protein n=1 Tax=Manihot esculenta TaxID=3983 RepID=A0A2C9WMC5_MANES